ncbi:MAG: nickel pincer cofactor biosynthesis protein LarB [Actinomycetaceae bacterium]|nr:nickel pincer cofactor biosynthesis protein LarB [Actinomycetaceae bacterium]
MITPDFDRFTRRGAAEAIFCAGKTPEQCALAARLWKDKAGACGKEIDEGGAPASSMERESTAQLQTAATTESPPDLAMVTERMGALIFTKAGPAHVEAIFGELPEALYDEAAQMVIWPPTPPAPSGGQVVVVSAGTSDLPIAREAALTAEFLGRRVREIHDVGVAGLHRVLAHQEVLARAAVIVVVAGMEGALVPVVAGLGPAPVVAVPTSVGYGASFEGVTALLAMLTSCVPGVGVVNIDNGYGAGHLAAQIAAPRQEDYG